MLCKVIEERKKKMNSIKIYKSEVIKKPVSDGKNVKRNLIVRAMSM